MIEEKIIDKKEQIGELLFNQQYNEKLDRHRSSYFYRGLPDISFELKTSLMRNCKNLLELEAPMLRNFTKYAALEDPTLTESVWRQMIVGQHHGLPTRLLDWTHSPLVALHFAMTEGNWDDLSKRDCVIWQIDARELNKLLPARYQSKLKEQDTFIMSVDMLNELVGKIEIYDEETDGKSMVILEPPSIDPRIVNQYSYFSVIPRNMNSIEQFFGAIPCKVVKYIIKKEIRWYVRDVIDQLNMNERIVYPGLDGISKWLARHFFVKEC